MAPFDDVDGDGTLEVVNVTKSCVDDCMDFAWSRSVWTWDGDTFAKTADAEPIDPPPDWGWPAHPPARTRPVPGVGATHYPRPGRDGRHGEDDMHDHCGAPWRLGHGEEHLARASRLRSGRDDGSTMSIRPRGTW